MKRYLSLLLIIFGLSSFGSPGDTLYVKTFSFDSISTRRAVFAFPDSVDQYGKILMYYTLKCDEATPHDKYPCGEWDYTTYTRVYLPGKEKITINDYPSFVVHGNSPKEYYYSKVPTWSVYKGYEKKETPGDYYLNFDGDDYLSVPGSALESVNDGFTAAFWVCGDASQPRRDAVFEATDANGERVINLHLPYDNGVLYFDAGGYGVGKNDNINLPIDPLYYKGAWTHYAVTKNNISGVQEIYQNGVLISSKETGKKGMNGITSMTIGALDNRNAQFFKGGLDEFMVWNKVLSAAEIQRAMYPDSWELPAEESLLLWYPVGEDGQKIVLDKSGNQMHATAWGVPEIIPFNGPASQLLKPQPGQQLTIDSVPNTKVHIVLFGDSLNPEIPTDTLFVYPGYRYVYNLQGMLVDSSVADNANLLQRKTTRKTTTKKEEEIVEIARFITPYGKRLDLGLNGFTWVYDVSDYAPLLSGEVDLQAGNGQELIDLRFAFIEGEHTSEPLGITNIYPFGSYTYEQLSDNEKLNQQMVRFNPKASRAIIRTRISGHGHAGPRNCCEWDPKTHFMLVNGDTLYQWQVWRDCGFNPVHPQGGTWQFDRAGWCPGTFVDTYDFLIPDSVLERGIANLDYAIQPYDPDNGEEKGNFEMTFQVIEFGDFNFELDASVETIIAPSDQHEYRRYNPLSTKPIIVLKNCGSQTITSVNLKYGMQTGKKAHFEWEGTLEPTKEVRVVLPVPSWKRMKGGERFFAEVIRVNGKRDENPLNDMQFSVVEEPVTLPEKFIVEVKTQGLGRAKDNKLIITDQDEHVVFQHLEYPEDSLVKDEVDLVRGAYKLVFSDESEDGIIRHWWNYYSDPTQVGENGSLRILDIEGNVIMDLGYDWAEKRQLFFFVGKPY